MDRIGAGLIAILSALFFAGFDIIASILVLLGFLIFRWAVITAPILGTFGLFQPASHMLRRLVNSVVAAIFNVIIFGTGAALYLFAVDLILSTDSLPGWLQVTLVLLCGIVGWVLLRPYQRITQLAGHGHDAWRALHRERWEQRVERHARDDARREVIAATAEVKSRRRRTTDESQPPRPETRAEEPISVRSDGKQAAQATAKQRTPANATEPVEPSTHAASRASRDERDERDEPPDSAYPTQYVIYRPSSGGLYDDSPLDEESFVRR
jgi:hypothetical protein